MITRDMKALAVLVVSLPLLTLPAQTLSITTAGQVRLDPPRPAVLFAAATPRSQDWEFVAEFAGEAVQVPTNRTRFYRAYVKAPPLKLLRVTETNQTLRGVCDKEFTNILLIVHGVTNKGWSYYGESRLGTNGTKMPVTTRSDFTFHRLPGITNTTPGQLIIWDDDGYILETNVLIGPGPFVILLPRHLRPKAGLSPASAPDPQTLSGWGLLSHGSSQTLEVPDPQYPACSRSVFSYSGNWDGNASSLDVTQSRCSAGKLEECKVSYTATSGPMLLGAQDGQCNYVPARTYSAWAEIGSYNSDTDDNDITSHYQHAASSEAELWLGGRLRGSAESNYWAVITVMAQRPVERILNNIVWGEPSNTFVNSIGGSATKNRNLYVQVPPDGLIINVKPGFGKMSHGWFHYWIEYVILPATEEN